MDIDIYITRNSGDSIIHNGLSSVKIWFQEPKLVVTQIEECFSQDHSETHDMLKGTLYEKNIKHHYNYRKNRHGSTEFGGELVMTDDKRSDMLPLFLELKEQGKLVFRHDNYKDGRHSHHRPNSVADIFGFDTEISGEIWELIKQDFQNDKPMTNELFLSWSDLEKEKPWWRFCKKLTLNVGLIKYPRMKL